MTPRDRVQDAVAETLAAMAEWIDAERDAAAARLHVQPGDLAVIDDPAYVAALQARRKALDALKSLQSLLDDGGDRS